MRTSRRSCGRSPLPAGHKRYHIRGQPAPAAVVRRHGRRLRNPTMSVARAPGAQPGAVELRSIDYVPERERHGGLVSQFTLWLAANLQITAIVTGALAVVFGGDVFFSLIGLLLGQLLGGAVMALHAAQGPQLGLPQMISSRVQFGVYGAIIPITAVCLMYIGFSASGCVLAGQAVGQLLHVDDGVGIVVFAVLIVAVTLFGYR